MITYKHCCFNEGMRMSKIDDNNFKDINVSENAEILEPKLLCYHATSLRFRNQI